MLTTGMHHVSTRRCVTAGVVLAALLAASACLGQPAPAGDRPLMKDFMGINGHTIHFRPELYKATCRLVRDYHNLTWDLGRDTSAATQFPMTVNEVDGRRRDWKDDIYAPWRREGWEINVCVQFSGLNAEDWKDLAGDAYAYGRSFAEYFGPSGPHKLADSVQIGNEPGWYDDASYRVVFENMARGVRAGDAELTIVTCAATPGESYRYAKSLSCFQGLEDLYDVISIHTYALKTDCYDRHRSYPEDPEIDYLRKVSESIAWRDEHAPGKPIWITEFGYDSSTRAAPETGRWRKWLDVTDEQQAQYLVRSFLAFSAMDVQRAYLYFFNDADEPWQHASSGLTRNFQPKPSFHAVAHLYATLGKYRFSRVVTRQPGHLYVYEYVSGTDEKELIWVAWAPTDTRLRSDVEIDVPAEPYRAKRMAITADEPQPIPCRRDEAGRVTLAVDGSPIYLWIRLP